MKKNLQFLLYLFIGVNISFAQNVKNEFIWPKTSSSKVAQDFVVAYNSGELEELKKFVIKHYSYAKSNQKEIMQNTEEWLDLFYRYGPIKPHSISINKEFDIEVWMECTISKNWFAPEFILNNQTNKIKAVGLLQGEIPEITTQLSTNQHNFLGQIENYLLLNEKANLFQGVVLIQKDQKTVFNKAYGLMNDSLGIKNTLDTRMRISSITKPITVTACLQLVQNGYLELDKPISNYLPELPLNISDKITVKSLIMHTSGYELDEIPKFREQLKKTKSIEEVYQLHLQFLPKWGKYKSFNPKGNYDYSNDSYDLLATIIEKITEMKFEEYLDKNIFQVSNMSSTSFSDENVALPYRYDINSDRLTNYKSQYPYTLGYISGAGGLKSTVEDITNFYNTLYHTEKLLNIPLKNLMFCSIHQSYTATNPDIGSSPLSDSNIQFNKKPKVKNGRSMGFKISYNENLNFGHNGTSLGNSAELRFFPHTGHLMVVLCNNRSGAHNFYNYFNQLLPKLD